LEPFTTKATTMFKGSFVALITPMHNNGDIDFTRLKNLIEWQVEQGSDGIVIIGTTSESPTLSTNERIEIIKTTIAQVNKRVPVIVGTGSNDTRASIENTKIAKDLGADAALLIAPYYNKPTQEGLYLHYKAINDAVSIPQILYNNPGRTVCDISPDTIIRLSKLENIIGLKECADIERIPDIKAQTENFALFTGNDPDTAAFIQAGGVGAISVTANIVPKFINKLCALGIDGNHQQAKLLQEKLQPLNKALFSESNPIAVKEALRMMGKIEQGIRLPLTPLSESLREPLLNELKELNLLPLTGTVKSD
jgi:4-hydroxy-tetrahydrodipicolinate synthase